jgi:hypothetical protein
MARIELQDVSKVYTGGVRAVNALSLERRLELSYARGNSPFHPT